MSIRAGTLHPDTSLFGAIALISKHQTSGAPVIDETGRLVGMFSERNCLQVLTAGEFYSDNLREEGRIGNHITLDFEFATPETGIYLLSQPFLTHAVHRLPILEDSEFMGQVSRRDLLRAREALGQACASRKHSPTTGNRRSRSGPAGSAEHCFRTLPLRQDAPSAPVL